MLDEKTSEMQAFSLWHTGGLSSALQLVDSTSNEIFSFADSTGGVMLLDYPIIPHHRELNKQIDEDQSWYWSPYWQAMEKEADKNSEDGDYEDFDDIDDFIASL